MGKILLMELLRPESSKLKKNISPLPCSPYSFLPLHLAINPAESFLAMQSPLLRLEKAKETLRKGVESHGKTCQIDYQ
ncbi:Hypothetical predicted protein [Podarcis lilfordi]|uniref:Uncharacterized protein n=1 Tax=Podarcis lilfordi TaxID=74358 RepID=A0AA35K7E9_9SAUR|nr:Hypothetical predicted protein [Podarcis lilfordi]